VTVVVPVTETDDEAVDQRSVIGPEGDRRLHAAADLHRAQVIGRIDRPRIAPHALLRWLFPKSTVIALYRSAVGIASSPF